jgi:hypothetical protein
MSFITGIPTEVLFANSADGTALASFTSEASLLGGMNGLQPVLPADFFVPTNGFPKTLKIRASGVLGATTSAPTYTFYVRIGTTIAVITGTSLLQSAAITSVVSASNAYWELEADLILRTPGLGTGNATLQAAGSIFSPGGFAAPYLYAMTPSASPSTWTVTIDPSVQLYLALSCACSASNAANTVQLKQLVVLGCN